MTVVALPQSRLELSAKRMSDATSLQAWLADRWAILFSHPEDFAQEQLEMDRWVSVLSRSFGARGVAPVALARAGSDSEQGWLARLAALDSGSAAVLALAPPHGAFADLSASALRARIARSGPRLAMIVDSSLRCRRTLSYRLPAALPSPLDLIGWAAALRKRDHAEESRYDVPEPSSLATQSSWMRNTRYSVAQDRG
jgi:hypothetical protein